MKRLFTTTLCLAALAFAGSSQASNNTAAGYISEILIMDGG
jgi:hypothetical protein